LLAIDLSAWKKPRASQAGRGDKRKAAISAGRA